jgi:hypothetical protein
VARIEVKLSFTPFDNSIQFQVGDDVTGVFDVQLNVSERKTLTGIKAKSSYV